VTPYGIRVAPALALLATVTIETHECGLAITKRYGYSIYDSLIAASALNAGCVVLYSEDFQHGQRVDGLTVRNPFVV
jgi:predicted nucleic acid-binding protein